MDNSLRRTSNPIIIRRWTEERGGHPARAVATPDSNSLGIAFDKAEPALELIGWERLFDVVNKLELDFVYQDLAADGSKSRFYKFIKRERE